MAIILGVDPGSRITGYGVIRADGRHIEYIDSGCIRVGEKPMAERLQTIFQSLATLIGEYRPEEFAIEQVFMARNPDSALKLGQARGAAIVSAANSGLAVHEYSARQVKFSTWFRCCFRFHANPRQTRPMRSPSPCAMPT